MTTLESRHIFCHHDGKISDTDYIAYHRYLAPLGSGGPLLIHFILMETYAFRFT